MREIKFRCWNKISGEMQYQAEDGFINRAYMGDNGYYQTTANIKKLSSLPECELMQYTGLKDKNGVEIYEGDVVTSKVRVLPDNLKYWTTEVVKPLTCTQFESGINEHQGDLYFHSEIQVLGNIHQNPELLRKCNVQN